MELSSSSESGEYQGSSSEELSNSELPNKCPVSISVHRADIVTSKVKEGIEELSELNIEVYDRHFYEEEVFGQVDKALEESQRASKSKQNDKIPKSQPTDFLKVIHDVDNKDRAPSRVREEQGLEHVIIALSEPNRKESTLQDDVYLSKQPETILIESSEEENEGDVTKGKNCVYANDFCSGFDDGYVCDKDVTLNDVPSKNKIKKKLKDDGNLTHYRVRMKEYNRQRAILKHANILDDGTEVRNLDETVTIEGDLECPEQVWNDLFEHQKSGVRWLWELNQLGTGGILGDEMGLGKTIQMIAFLVALRTSNLLDRHTQILGLGPTVLVCPATVMHQWLMECRTWWPPFRVGILHSTGTFIGKRRNLVDSIHKSNGILIVSYQGTIIYQRILHDYNWHYAVLDEGHKIRNPDAQVTLACKRFRTPHRIILSGSPLQNNLKELWSIFDFIYPGKLGALPVFMEQFAKPITQGGYANASDLQLQVAYKSACILRDTIKPFLLRRSKTEINNKLKLPNKSEQVLFCKLTEKQRSLYKAFLSSPTIRDIKRGTCQIFVGLIYLRKICNHPDLFDATDCESQYKSYERPKRRDNNMTFVSNRDASVPFGHYTLSGKMMVVDVLLKLWKKQEHKVLLFTQSRQMLKILIKYLHKLNYTYLYMDGTTQIGSRQSMIEKFNNDPNIFIFLLTTRVGGVGVNLVGANRVIIYDPDWNPSTDIQARERAWRIGQHRDVIIYRLITAGTIEEKIYHRQVFKLYLTNRILKDAKQKRFFKTNDLHELFTLSEDSKNIETKALFEDSLQINPGNINSTKTRKKEKRKKKKLKCDKDKNESDLKVELTDKKIEAMREQAKAISKMIALKFAGEIPAKPETVLSTDSSTTRRPISSSEKQTKQRQQQCVVQEAPTQRKKLCDEGRRKSKPVRTPVDHLVRQTVYKPPKIANTGDDNEDDEEEGEGKLCQDSYVLKRLFKKSNIFGALKHDRIESDSKSDYRIVEQEADKIARDAIKTLRESRPLCLSAGIPNFDNRNGLIAKPTPSTSASGCDLSSLRRGRLTRPNNNDSEQGGGKPLLLDAIKKRNHLNPMFPRCAGEDEEDSDDAELRQAREISGIADGTGADKIASQLRQFLLYEAPERGKAQTEQVLDLFKRKFEPSKTAIFKAILYRMCEFERRAGLGFWLLKSEYKSS